MACAVVPIATRVGGLPEVVDRVDRTTEVMAELAEDIARMSEGDVK
jgi:glycogen synthase